jgi:predicted ATPase
MLSTLAIAGYRSLRDVVVPLTGLTLVTGPNGSGKSSLYRALRLLAETAQGRLVPTLAREGGLQSTLWAGPESFSRSMLSGERPVQGTRRKNVISLRLGFASDDFGYAIDLGLPTPSSSAFEHDPQIKRECVWSGEVLRPSTLLVDRRNSYVRARAAEGNTWIDLTQHLSSFDSMMTHCADPRNTPELLLLRESIRGWRFYDQLRTDAAAPARLPQIGTHTPVLSSDGADFAAALRTIIEIGDAVAVEEAVTDAFPGATVSVTSTDGWFDVEMHQHGLLRPLKSAELSDGTLRYLLWIAALLTPRPPALMVLNEPETSLHPDLLPALARLIVRTADRAQVLVVSHAVRLIDALQQDPTCHSITLDKRFGETCITSLTDTAPPRWQWPAR